MLAARRLTALKQGRVTRTAAHKNATLADSCSVSRVKGGTLVSTSLVAAVANPQLAAAATIQAMALARDTVMVARAATGQSGQAASGHKRHMWSPARRLAVSVVSICATMGASTAAFTLTKACISTAPRATRILLRSA